MVEFWTFNIEELKEEPRNDLIWSVLREQIYVRWSDKAKDISTSLRPYWLFRDVLSVDDFLVLKRGRILISNIMGNKNLNKIHTSYQDIEKRIPRVKTCILERNKQKKPSKDPYTPKISNQSKEGNYDTTQNSFQVMESSRPQAGAFPLLCGFHHSKILLIRKMHNACTSQDAICALKSIFGEYSILEHIISDNE